MFGLGIKGGTKGGGNIMITKEMVKYWLEDNSNQWIPNVIVDICNDPHDIEHLKKQIKYEWKNKLKEEREVAVTLTKKRGR